LTPGNEISLYVWGRDETRPESSSQPYEKEGIYLGFFHGGMCSWAGRGQAKTLKMRMKRHV